MVLFIAGDIGGTNSRLQLLRATRHVGAGDKDAGEGEVVVGEEIYSSKGHETLEEVIFKFLTRFNPKNEPVHCMCLAVAGPVNNNVAHITNLTWKIDGPSLRDTFRMEEVRIINDFVGIGYGLLALSPSEMELIPGSPQAKPNPTGVKAVIGAGTGLGECFLTYNGKNYDVFPAEGGHADFAPRNKTEFEIQEYIKRTDNIDRVSIERVTSGLGLPRIYEYLAARNFSRPNPEVAAQISVKGADKGRIIAESARDNKCPVCIETMDLFTETYGAEAGNLCLKTLPHGGLYIAGGIAAKNRHLLSKNENQFARNFKAKGRLAVELEKVPVYLITHPQVGLLGSKVICRRIINKKAEPIPSKL